MRSQTRLRATRADRRHLGLARASSRLAALGHDKAQDLIDQIISQHTNGPPMGMGGPMRGGPMGGPMGGMGGMRSVPSSLAPRPAAPR